MKKVLFATTALVLSAGVAAAEVSLSGDGRMGVVYSFPTGALVPAATGNEWQFSSRVRVTFTLSGTTDSGIEFGGSFRADNAAGAAAGTAGTVFVKGAFGTVRMGDVASAPEALFGDLAAVGYMGDSQTTGSAWAGTNDIPYLTLDNGTQSALQYVGTFGPWSVAAALSDGVTEGSTALVAGATNNFTSLSGRDQQYSVAAAYTFGNYTVGLGHEVAKSGAKATRADMRQTELAGVGTFGNTAVKAYYAFGKVDTGYMTARFGEAAAGVNAATGVQVSHKAYGVSVASTFGATTVNAYVQRLSVDPAGAVAGAGANAGRTSVTWYGLGADYDLGGGAVLSAGIQDDNANRAAGIKSKAVASVGVKFTF